MTSCENVNHVVERLRVTHLRGFAEYDDKRVETCDLAVPHFFGVLPATAYQNDLSSSAACS